MMPHFPSRLLFISLLVLLPATLAHADTASVSIQSLTPGTAVEASSTLTFVAAAQGFINPTYSVTDSTPTSGGTSGHIDAIGDFSWTPTIYDAGWHSLLVSVTDTSSHNASTTVSILVKNNNLLVTQLTPGTLVGAGHPVSLKVLAPGFQSPVFYVFDSAWQSTVSAATINSTGLFTWTPATSDVGTHTLTFTASDIYGHQGTITQSIFVFVPSVTIQSVTPSGSVPAGKPLTFTATSTLPTPVYSVSDVYSGTTTLSASAITAATGLFSWTASTTDIGVHTITVRVTDAAGNSASNTISLAVVAPVAVTSAVSTVAPTPPAAHPTSSYLFTTALTLGSRGTAVTELQKRLVSLGFLAINPTGYYGPATVTAVKKYQTQHKLSPVGSVGPATRKALNAK